MISSSHDLRLKSYFGRIFHSYKCVGQIANVKQTYEQNVFKAKLRSSHILCRKKKFCLETKTSFLFDLSLMKNAKTICSMKHSLEFSNSLHWFVMEWMFEIAAAKKLSFSRLFIVA